MNTTETGSVRAAVRDIGPTPDHEYTWREGTLTVRSVRTFAGAWNVIIDQDAASDGSRDGITLDAGAARELARLLLDGADGETAEAGSAYEHRLEEARRWYARGTLRRGRPPPRCRGWLRHRRPRGRPGYCRAV